MMTRLKTLALALLAASSTAAVAQNVTVVNAKLVIGDGSPVIENGTVVIRNGKVEYAGPASGAPAGGGQAVDAAGKYVTPGIVAGFSRVGIIEIDAISGTNDSSARQSVYSAAIDIAPALNPLGAPVAVNRLNGVTRALVYPGSANGLFNGRGALVDLANDRNMVTRAGVFQYLELGETGATRAGGSRPAAILMFRQLMQEAQDFAANPAAYDGRNRGDILSRADAQALLRVLDGRDRLFIKVNRGSDILSVIQLLRDFPRVKPTLIGVAEGWTVADAIAAARIPVIASALNDLPESFEQLAATQSNIGRMRAAGVEVAIGLVDDNEIHRLGYARQYAGNLVALGRVPGASGLTWDQAFASIANGPAVAAGVDSDVGSLKRGRVGDVVIWDGDPLELSSAPTAVYIDGVAQPMTSRQLELRNRYMNPQRGALPPAYNRPQ